MDRPGDAVPDRALHNWFITLPGAKKEETALSTLDGGRILTLAGAWPSMTVPAEQGEVEVADLYVR